MWWVKRAVESALLRSNTVMVQNNRRFVLFARKKDKTNSNVEANDPQGVEISFLSRRDLFHEKKETCVFVLQKHEIQKWSSVGGAVVRGRRSCQ